MFGKRKDNARIQKNLEDAQRELEAMESGEESSTFRIITEDLSDEEVLRKPVIIKRRWF